MEEKWRLSKKEGSSSSSFTRSFSTTSSSTTTSSKAPPFLKKSSSLKIFTSSPPKPPLPRSSSLKASPPKVSPSFSWRFSQKARKCTSMAKEQKARFYIMRRCVAMLVCWHKHGD